MPFHSNKILKLSTDLKAPTYWREERDEARSPPEFDGTLPHQTTSAFNPPAYMDRPSFTDQVLAEESEILRKAQEEEDYVTDAQVREEYKVLFERASTPQERMELIAKLQEQIATGEIDPKVFDKDMEGVLTINSQKVMI